MDDQTQTNAQLPAEVAALRARVAELEALEAERERAEQVQSALYRIADAASAATDMPAFYAAMHRIVGELMYANNFFIALYDGARQVVSFPFYVDEVDTDDWPAPHVWFPMGAHKTRGTTGYVLRTGRPVLITPEVYAELIRQGEIERVGVPAVDFLGVPLKTEGRTLGIVAVQSYREEIRYTEQDKALLTFVGQHIATALSRARAIEETRQRNAELAIVNEVGQALAAQLDFQSIIELVGERVRAIFDASNLYVALYDRQTNLIHFPYYIARGERIVEGSRELGTGLTSIVIESRQPLVLGTWAQQLELDVIPDRGDIEQSPAESWLGVPIVAGDDVIGVVSVHRLEQHAFSESDVNLLSTLASSMSVALENARLFDETNRLLAETQQRAAELAIINSVQQGLAAQLDLQAIIDLVGDRVRGIFDVRTIYIALYDRQTNLIHFPYEMNHGNRLADRPQEFGKGLTSIVIQSRQPLVIDTWARALQLGAILTPGDLEELAAAGNDLEARTWSYLGVPMIAGDEVIGVVGLRFQQSCSESDINLLSTLACSMAVALENARLFEETKRLLTETEQRNSELAAINMIQQSLASQLDSQAIIDLVGRQIWQIIDANVVFVALYDQQAALIRFPYYLEEGQREYPEPIALGKGLTSNIVLSRRPLLLNTFEQQRALGVLSDGRPAESWLGVPILLGEDSLGVVSVQNYRQHVYGERDIRLLSTLAASMAVALDNARLFEETKRLLAETEQRNAELALINSVQQALAQQLDFQAIIDLVGDNISETFKTDCTYIGLYDRQTQIVHFPYYIERGYRHDVKPNQPGEDPPGLTRRVIESRQPLLLGTRDEQAQHGSIPVMTPGEEADTKETYLGVPILLGDAVIGLVSVQRYQQRAYGDRDLRLLMTLAASMAVALENARLFDETQRLFQAEQQRAAELETVNRIGQALASELELDALIQLTGEQVRQTFAADIAYVALHDHATGMIHFPYEYGDTLSSIRFGEGLSSRIIATGEPLLINEDVAGQHSTLQVAPVGVSAKSFLGVPIMVGEVAIGVISVQSTRQEGRFGEADVHLLSTVAANVGAAIANARLYQETQRHAREMAALAEVGREISASLDLPTVLERIAAHAQDLLHGRDVVLRLLEPDGRLPAVVALGEYAEIYKAWQVQLGYGLTGHIAQTGAAEIVNDPINDPRVASIPGTEEDEETEAMIFAPLLTRERVIGIMTVWRDKTVSGPFAQSDLDFMVGLARQAAIAIENARLFAEIQRQKQFSEALIEASPVAIIHEDLNQHVISWNPAAEALFGYTREEAAGRHIDDLVANRPDIRQDADRYTRAIARGMTHGIGRRTRKDGQLVDVEFFAVPVIMGGQDVAQISLYHDITELQKARHEAIAANEAKSVFLANMSHELRTPLNAIIGFTRIVRRKAEGALPDKQLDNLDKVLASGEHLLSLINTVLDIAKIEAGRMDVQPSNFNAAALVEACATTAQPLLRPGVALLKDVAPDLPPVYSDQDKVKQILLNLLSNAAKFTHAGTIKLRVSSEFSVLSSEFDRAATTTQNSKLKTQNLILFEVIDTGIGISQEALGRVFEEFQQADTSTTRQYGGTGLGLSISRHLARLLGGDLVAASTPGNGSTFTLTIPIHYGQRPARAETARADAATLPLSAERPIVLAIDDDPDAIEILHDNLAEAGYQVVGARGGDEGVWQAKQLRPYAITLDIMMPDKDGWQVLHDLKSDPATRDIPVILLTIVDKKALGYQLGASDYLVKPLDREALLAALGRMAQANGGIAPKRLLVVDDDPNVIEMVQQLLGEAPYEVLAAADGLAALDAIARRRPDAILLDLMLPRLDGFGVIEQLRQSPEDASIPIVVLTAKTLTGEESARLKESVAQVMQKQGLEGDTLIRELRRALQPAAAHP